MTAHSLLGASSAYRWLACPGSFHLSQQHPHRPSSVYAATGTLAHELIEEAVTDRKTEIGTSEIGRTWSQDGHLITIDQDLIDGVNVMLDYLSGVTALSDWSKVEFRVSLDGYFTAPPVPMFGTVDAGVLSFFTETLEIVDYKNGAGVTVNPIENPQLLYYAAGVLQHLPRAQRDRVQHLKLTIVQPHAPGLNPIRSWEISVVDLLMWVDEVLVPGVHACTQDNAPLNPGSWCRFCPVSHACPRLQQDAVAMAQREFDDADVVMPTEPGDLAFSLDVAERAALWIDRVREHAVEQLKSQVRIPGWGLVPTRPTRKWKDETTVAQDLGRTAVFKDKLWERKLRSPAQVEKAFSSAPRETRYNVGELIKLFTESVSSGVKLARTGKPDPSEEFADEA
jgi:hypothetical protein